ncbi:MAG: hypothetical protein IKJ39_03155 [Lachnospiraceae bacterium]|nr:hypothetical protein [Lachnospiraceae bacterium]
MKQQISQFFTWLRNGTCFCFTWFLLLLTLLYLYYGKDAISTTVLLKLFILSFGGVLLFCLLFTSLAFKKWLFVTRLTCFMICITLYECVGFYWLGIFSTKGSLKQWGIFMAIVLCLYFICIAIYHQYSKKKGELYTQALQTYQEKRRLTIEE